MLTRNENGKLQLSTLDLQIFIGDLLEKCKTWKEVEWVAEQIRDYTNSLEEERLDELNREVE